MSTSKASVPTANASRYLQQLCKHWSHKMTVSFDESAGTVTFPNGSVAAMAAKPETLDVTLSVPENEDMARLQKVVAEHLDRFAFREAPLAFDWN